MMNLEQSVNKFADISEGKNESRILKPLELSETIKEIPEAENKSAEVLKPGIAYIESTSVTALFEQNRAVDNRKPANFQKGNEALKKLGLSEYEKEKFEKIVKSNPVIDSERLNQNINFKGTPVCIGGTVGCRGCTGILGSDGGRVGGSSCSPPYNK